MTTQENTNRDAALDMLKRGIASPSEVAALAGATRQLVRYWIKFAAVDWRKARDARLKKEWRARLRGGSS